jgi:hypothetical protein
MAKRQIKARIVPAQDGLCALTGTVLPIMDGAPDFPIIDTDRLTMKVDAGIYTDENTQIVDPVAHMASHGNLREREAPLDTLKSLFDDRVQVMRLQLKINNQLLAYERRVDSKHPETSAFLLEQIKPIQQRLAQIDKQIAGTLKVYPDSLVQTALAVPGLGPITVAALTVYIDFEKLICMACRLPRIDPSLMAHPKHRKVAEVEDDEDGGVTASMAPRRFVCTCGGLSMPPLVIAAATPSALWKYVGLHCASHERYVKGEKGGGNKTLRTVLWNTANVLMKLGDRSAYRIVYDQTKARLAISEKLVQTRNTQGKLVECAWKDTKPSHRHGAALRAVVKHLLADYWLVGRTLKGMSTVPLYAEAMLGHTHIVDPRSRGWVF